MKLTPAERKMLQQIEERINELILYQEVSCDFKIRKQRKDNKRSLGHCSLRFNTNKMKYQVVMYIKHESARRLRIATILHETVHVIQYIMKINAKNYKNIEHKEFAALYLDNAYIEYCNGNKGFEEVIEKATSELNALYGYRITQEEYIRYLRNEENILTLEVVTKDIVKSKKEFCDQYIDILKTEKGEHKCYL